MKINLRKDQLLPGLSTVQNIVSVRTPVPVLGNVLLQTQESTLLLSTTDLDIGMRCEVKATVLEHGAITLPAKRFFNIVREVPTEEFTLEVDAKFHASIRAGKSFFKIRGITAEDFPPSHQLEGALIKMPQSQLKEMVKTTSYCMSSDDSRYTLNGLFFQLADKKLTIVATDGRRLARAETEVLYSDADGAEIIVPSKAVMELEKMLSEEGDVEIVLTANQISFTAGQTQMISKLVDGKYPNYQQVIPSDTIHRATIERELLLSAVRRVSVVSSDKTHSVKMHLSAGNLEVSTNSPDVGEANESIAINYKGGEFTIAFNPEFVMDLLKNLNASEIYFDFTDELSPAIFRYNKPFIYVIMPMRST